MASFAAANFFGQLSPSDTSEGSVRRYRSIIQQNRQLVSLIEYTFSSRGVPKHLRNLAIIESGLDRNVVSHTGAKGVWQFMTEHANHYGLAEQDRSDMYKSTKTVVNSLINLYNKYGNWITVVAAYNCGEGNIQKAMNKAGSRRYTDFSAFLPAETRNHVIKYLNACYATGELNQVMADYYKTPATAPTQTPKKRNETAARHNLTLKQDTENLSQTVINSSYNLQVIAKIINTPLENILQWNPGITEKLRKNGESLLFLPRDLMMDFELNRTKILTASFTKK